METNLRDIFKPRTEPAASLYKAFQAEAMKRKGRSTTEWITAELGAVWQTAVNYAQQHGLDVPTLAEVEAEERSASGHADYGAKWAYGVARLLEAGRGKGVPMK
jgi:hypothetical protein